MPGFLCKWGIVPEQGANYLAGLGIVIFPRQAIHLIPYRSKPAIARKAKCATVACCQCRGNRYAREERPDRGLRRSRLHAHQDSYCERQCGVHEPRIGDRSEGYA
jgi:hypothetical protein